jgi:hypothetical protein
MGHAETPSKELAHTSCAGKATREDQLARLRRGHRESDDSFDRALEVGVPGNSADFSDCEGFDVHFVDAGNRSRSAAEQQPFRDGPGQERHFTV